MSRDQTVSKNLRPLDAAGELVALKSGLPRREQVVPNTRSLGNGQSVAAAQISRLSTQVGSDSEERRATRSRPPSAAVLPIPRRERVVAQAFAVADCSIAVT